MMNRCERKTLEKKLGYRFRRRHYLEAALTHPSYRHENDGVDEDNQRLEFLGDAALGLVTAADLYHRFDKEPEGVLTDLRSRLANRDTLAHIGHELELGPLLRLGRGEERSGGRERASTLTDATEALIGAAYLDGGYKAVERIYRKLWNSQREDDTAEERAQQKPHATVLRNANPKGKLQEYCQKKWKVSPEYQILSETGPSHARHYEVVAVIRDQPCGVGRGSNKRSAEIDAARATLNQFNV